MYITLCKYPWRPENAGSLGTGVTGGYELPGMDSGT